MAYTVLTSDEFDDWLNSLRDEIAREAIAARLLRVEAGSLGDHKSLGEGLFELRIHYGPGFRLYCTFSEGVCVVVLSGGYKGDQRRDIRRARNMLSELP